VKQIIALQRLVHRGAATVSVRTGSAVTRLGYLGRVTRVPMARTIMPRTAATATYRAAATAAATTTCKSHASLCPCRSQTIAFQVCLQAARCTHGTPCMCIQSDDTDTCHMASIVRVSKTEHSLTYTWPVDIADIHSPFGQLSTQLSSMML
jgi:hypothetical protein